MKKIFIILTLAFIIVALNLSAVSADNNVFIFSAASLTDAMTEIAQEFEAKYPEIDLKLNFASSGALQKQIEQGAPADYFISAGIRQMDALEADALITNRINLLKNRMVVAGILELEDKILEMDDLSKAIVKYIAVGMPESVPAGHYAKESLEYFGLWDNLQEKIVLTKDVRQALTYVETGNSDLAIVYSSDAAVLNTGKVLIEIPAEAHSPIIYPAAVIKDSDKQEEALLFREFLMTDQSHQIFKEYGFIIN